MKEEEANKTCRSFSMSNGCA